jgi:hypothetical protein
MKRKDTRPPTGSQSTEPSRAEQAAIERAKNFHLRPALDLISAGEARAAAKRQAIPTLPAKVKVGWRVKEWSEAVGLSHSTVYDIIGELKTVKIGSIRIILTTPTEYLESKYKQQKGKGYEYGGP